MVKKGIILCTVLTIAVTILMTLSFLAEENYETENYSSANKQYRSAQAIYQIYLNGNKIGLINSKDELYNLINEEQKEIKNEYKVDQVYPPKGFQIVRKYTHDNQLSTVEEIYNIIKTDKAFTLKGYAITIRSNEEGVEPQYIYVLDQKVFKEALENIVKTFIGDTRYEQFLTSTQPEIIDTGFIIENMFFQENITIKESLINSDEKIYTDVNELTKFLLFDKNPQSKEYIVKSGDTIESIAEENELNITELLIANDEIPSEDTLLAIGQKINVALINPLLNLTYDELETTDNRVFYKTEYVDDPTQYIGYKKVQTNGENGIERVTNRVRYINGFQSGSVFEVGDGKIIKPTINEVIIRGTKQYPTGGGTIIDIGNTNWLWPTDSYRIYSNFGWRGGEYHDGIDIPRPAGSPIYAALDGVVINASRGGPAGPSAGINVVIMHANGYSTVYAHCSTVYVKVNQEVKQGDVIAGVGMTGVASGNHLHFGVFKGVPYSNGKGINPLPLYR